MTKEEKYWNQWLAKEVRRLHETLRMQGIHGYVICKTAQTDSYEFQRILL